MTGGEGELCGGQLLIYHVEIFFESKQKFQDIVWGLLSAKEEKQQMETEK